MLRKQYDSVFSIPNEENTISNPDEFFPINDPVAELDNIPFNWNYIIDQIDNLKAGAAAGPDGIPAILLKKCKHSLETMFRIFLQDGCIPDLSPRQL